MLGRFVISAAQLDQLSGDINCCFAVLSEADHPRADAIESKTIISIAKPTYCEVPLEQLDAVKKAGAFAKLRTGGITPDAIPTVDSVASYILGCAERRLPFKATAGLHHPIRSNRELTYKADALVATMHGFMNVFLAAAFAGHGRASIHDVLAEMDPAAFRFDADAHWRDWSLSGDQIAAARRDFAHSFGSCSFEEPIEDLERLGWL